MWHYLMHTIFTVSACMERRTYLIDVSFSMCDVCMFFLKLVIALSLSFPVFVVSLLNCQRKIKLIYNELWLMDDWLYGYALAWVQYTQYFNLYFILFVWCGMVRCVVVWFAFIDWRHDVPFWLNRIIQIAHIICLFTWLWRIEREQATTKKANKWWKQSRLNNVTVYWSCDNEYRPMPL